LNDQGLVSFIVTLIALHCRATGGVQ